jgi:serine/threonine protein kinase
VPVDLSNLAVGTLVPGTKWVVCGQLGEGGMGRVLEVVKEPGIRGAMKIIRPDVSHRRDFVARFLTEVRLLANLEHRNIVRVFDFDRIDDEMPFVVMELLVGGTLRQVMRAHGRPLPAPMAYEIMRQACDGLDRAHSATPSVIHRDFKPENVFLHRPAGDQPVVKVMDFGLATLADGERDRGLFGTLRYMAPEQLRGERATVRSDVYAAALVLYEMLTGRMPWDFDVVRVEDAHLSIAPRPPSHFAPWIPRSVDRHVLSALSKNPANRPRDAFAFMARLYELQWAERPRGRVDAATTTPNLAALAVTPVPSGVDRMAATHALGPPTLPIPRGDTERLLPAPRATGHPAHDGYRSKSDAAISRSLHPDRRTSSPPRSLLRRHMVEAAVFAGTIAIAMPAALLIERGRSSAPAVAAPPATSLAAPLPSPRAASALAPPAATLQEPPADPVPAIPNAQASTSASARPSPSPSNAKSSAHANLQDPAREFMPWPAHP